ncbi:MAG: hypothetical protein EOO20_11715 [Chryseobacterium sp.]|nr:MAG: hypothetical protein EOO20_11715 [Chryseobacterium sp.]
MENQNSKKEDSNTKQPYAESGKQHKAEDNQVEKNGESNNSGYTAQEDQFADGKGTQLNDEITSEDEPLDE